MFKDKFKSERGRINCSLWVESGKWRWLGIQYVIAEYWILDNYNAIPVFNFVGNKFALSKSDNEFCSIIPLIISVYFSPIAA